MDDCMNILQFISSIPIFQGFTQDELVAIQQISHKQEIGPNIDIIKEGEISEDFFVLLNGKAEVLKFEGNEQGTQQFKLTTLSGGDICGEIAFIDHSPRSSTVRTVEPTTILHISIASILQAPHGKMILNKLIKNIAKTSIKRLRDFNDHHINNLQNTFDLVQKKQNFGIFFIVLLTLFSFVTVTEYVIQFFNFNLRSLTSSMIRLFIICSPCFYWIWKLKIPIKTFGISTQNWMISILEGIGMGLVLAVAAISIDSLYNGITFQSTLTAKFMNNFQGFRWLIIYAVSSYIQEFVARGPCPIFPSNFLK
jgi:CRP-like cAMP-binding protein